MLIKNWYLNFIDQITGNVKVGYRRRIVKHEPAHNVRRIY